MRSDTCPLDGGDKQLMRQCPFPQFVPKKLRGKVMILRMMRIAKLTRGGFLHGKIATTEREGHNMRITLTAAGRAAIGLPPELTP